MTDHAAIVGSDRTEQERPRPYEPPALTEIGSIEEITLGHTGSGQDMELAVSPDS